MGPLRAIFARLLLGLLPLAPLGLLLLTPPALHAQAAVIEKIEFQGNRRIPRDTLRARIFSKEGDPYDEDALRRDFQALWNTGWFEDIKIETDKGEKGLIVIFRVTERPIIRSIDYQGLSSVTQSDVLERFRDRKVGLSVESQFDPTKVKRAEVVLKELLAEHGRHFAEVRTEVRRIPPTAVGVTFVVAEGPKVKMGEFSFEGNTVFSKRRIVRAMKHSRPMGVPPWFYFIAKTYDANKLQEDLEGIRNLYQDEGYFRILVQDPQTSIRDTTNRIPLPWVFRKPGKEVDIKIKLEEGGQYRLGEMKVTGVKLFKEGFIKDIFLIKPGEIFSVTKIRKSLESYRKLYGEFGYINFTAIPETDIHDDTKTIDFILQFEEDKQFFINRIEFVGNTTTRDKVIRRELLLDEGDIFNSRLWDVSLLRLNQLNYFETLKPEHADVKQNAKEGTVDITLKVKEKGKNSIGFSGGVSGIAGSFVGLNYQTNNFLGLGETLTFETEYGDRQRNFLFGFTEPYFRDRPLATGFTVFARRFRFDQARETSLLLGQQVQIAPELRQNFDQSTRGFTLFGSYPLKRWSFTRIGLTFGYDISSISPSSDASRQLFEQLNFRGLEGTNSLTGIRSSKIIPTFLYNTVDDYFFPTRGKYLFISMEVEGGPLQGNINSLRPVVEAKYFKQVNKRRNVLGVRFLGAYVTGYGGKVAPPFGRFYMGGEDTVRGFDIRAISPIALIPTLTRITPTFFVTDPTQLDAEGNPITRLLFAPNTPVLTQNLIFPGGDTQVVTNVEYRIPIVGPVSLSIFADAGLNMALNKGQLRMNAAGLRQIQDIFGPQAGSSNLSILSGTNSRLRTSVGVELVVNLPIVNAPFRFYWAYNPTRLVRSFSTPSPQAILDRNNFFVRDANGNLIPTTVPDSVFQNQIVPQMDFVLRGLRPQSLSLVEPLKTFRFTISRTF